MVARLLESVQARPRLSEEDAPRTSDALGFLLHRHCFRRDRTEIPLSARCVSHATGSDATL